MLLSRSAGRRTLPWRPISRRLCLLWPALLAALIATSAAAFGAGSGAGEDVPLTACPLRFAVIGDRTGGAVPGKYEESLLGIERLRPEFAVTVGDMIEGYTSDTTEIKRQWEEYKGLLSALTMPVYFTPGNHDITEPSVLGLYKRYVGEPYHSFDVRGVHFIELDNGRYASADAFPKEQADWLAADLSAHKDAPLTFVFMHVPYWRDTVAKGKPDQLHHLFVEYGVDAVFTGHDHIYYGGKFDGITYTGVGASGAVTEPGLTGLEHHFVWVTADDKGFSISPVKTGSVLGWDDVTIADVLLVASLQAEAVLVGRVPVGTALAVPETPVEVTVKNVHENLSVKSALKWEVPAGWTVSPGEASIDLAPATSKTFAFSVARPSGLYPAPTFSLAYPYREGKTSALRRTLPVARTAYAFRTEGPVRIDGVLDEAAWHDPVTAFFGPEGEPVSTDPTAFYFAWDLENLYLAARCDDKEISKIVAVCAEHDCAVYGEDCVGYFLEPETADGPVYQIYFNANGVSFDQKINVVNGFATDTDPAWNGSYEAKTSRGADWWAIEVRIPLSEISGRAEAGKQWALNFRRKQRRLGTSADWQAPIGYDPNLYGILEFK